MHIAEVISTQPSHHLASTPAGVSEGGGGGETHPDHLRTGVVRTAAARLQRMPVRLQGRHAEVGHADVVLFVQQQVLRLQVTVAATASQKAYRNSRWR